MYLSAAYWFTTSISFAHPAVTIARCLNNTFAGIRPKDAPLFILAQFVAWLAATLLFRWLALGFRAQAKQLLVAHEENRSIEVEAGQQRRHR
jgi:glycerol uptake facilitator-like aquaporin